MRKVVLVASTALVAAAASPVWGQSIKAEGNIETDKQLVSKAAQGTAPLQVASKTKVTGLNADFLDGNNSSAFALVAELLAAIESLDNPDPPCVDTTHRFVDCGNGTVTDTATGIVWLENPGCFTDAETWVPANQKVAMLFDGATVDSSGGDCGLDDGSRPGDWRLPTEAEWDAILNATCDPGPKILGNGTPVNDNCFSADPWASGVLSNSYHTSVGSILYPESQRRARLDLGVTDSGSKTELMYLWPVRGARFRLTRVLDCPTGEFVTGFDRFGELKCAPIPPP